MLPSRVLDILSVAALVARDDKDVAPPAWSQRNGCSPDVGPRSPHKGRELQAALHELAKRIRFGVEDGVSRLHAFQR
jgi:hypothetical protein